MTEPKPGDMLRFTQWHNTRGVDPRLQKGEVIWGIAMSDSVFDPILGHNPQVGESPTAWGFDDEDTFEVVPIEEWPGEVCAIMAQRALTGESR